MNAEYNMATKTLMAGACA